MISEDEEIISKDLEKAMKKRNKDKENERKSEELDENVSKDSKDSDESYLRESEDNIRNILIDDKNNKKLFRKVMASTRRQAFSDQSIDGLLRVLRNAFAYHRFKSAAKLMIPLVRDQRSPHFVIVKAAFILLTQSRDNCSNNNSLFVQSMKKISKYDINKREIMLEIVLNYIRNNDTINAKQFIDNNETLLKWNWNLYRSYPIVDTWLRSYVCLIDFMDWKQSIAETNSHFYYHSNRLIAEKTKLSLKNIITDNKDIVFDIFVFVLIELYEKSQQFSELMDLLEVYVHNNECHLNAYIYYYKYSKQYLDYCSAEQHLNSLKAILKYSPENPLVLDLIRKKVLTTAEEFDLLMEFIDYEPNRNHMEAWLLLKHFVIAIKGKTDEQLVRNLWRETYESYWVRLHCALNVDESDDNVIKVIECKREIIAFFYSPNHSFVIQTKSMFE